MNREWEAQARNWLAWARTPGHDAYWHYAPAFFRDVVPPPSGRTLEIGAGEGRVTRDLRDSGHSVTAVDTAPTLLREAAAADPSSTYVLSDGAALPFADESFALVVAYNSLMDVDDMPATVAEASRVLTRDGSFCVCVTHPVNDAGEFEGQDEDARFTIDGSYFGRRAFHGTVERDGLQMTFSGRLYDLESYATAFERAGLVIERVREPQPDDHAVAARSELARWRRVPMFLFARLRKRAVG
ncbi:MAG TPA: class I SAM-dependent methyltransferase [Actinomycetota bacterium]